MGFVPVGLFDLSILDMVFNENRKVFEVKHEEKKRFSLLSFRK